jgi:hypothetical protein
MASLPKTTLTPLQVEILRAFFERERGFYLTGGAALSGYHLGHRTTDELDLFTADPQAFERGRFVLGDVASSIGARLEIRQDAPGFLRAAIVRDDAGVVVDMVRDQSFQVQSVKPEYDGIRIDPPDEILANKLAAVLGRAEERDLVDLMLLERAGYRIEDALPAAPATLAWLLSEVSVPDGVTLAGVDPAELRAFVADLVVRLRRIAHP